MNYKRLYRSPWRKNGHCNRCNNGDYHTYNPGVGVIMSPHDPGRIPHIYMDEVAPGEKPVLHRRIRRRSNRAWRREYEQDRRIYEF